MFRFFPRVSWSTLTERAEITLPVIAPSASGAANLVADEMVNKSPRPFEVECAGPRGGIIHRFRGWESLIGAQMFAARANYVQGGLL